LARRVEDGRIVRRAEDVAMGDALEVQLADGSIEATVTGLASADRPSEGEA
jgi:exonuclease VII large subunit